ncbi:triose-phosphate isomerase [Shinella sumterensis]|uniref:Triosephosphate isomerase n=1 Tax=Shinella sumterensis TaxID=1967501 RepID=A0AA50CR13_9HYPH|nr:triose-phosphate isomerase [Shinella sumterensis]WLS00506.1 triose-phosphate isomerase [Shinella sumterensis]
MTPAIRPLLAGNWKMNGTASALATLEAIAAGIAHLPDVFDTLLCTPATLVHRAASAAKATRIQIGGQDCHTGQVGAHTGDVSADMLADCGARFVIVGHSERRADHAETDDLVCRKARAAIASGLTAIVCIGETGAEKAQGKTLAVVERQLLKSVPDSATPRNVVVAYEPVWAIGTGLTPTVKDVAEVHRFMRDQLSARFGSECAGMRLLYGGSVKGANAHELMGIDHVDGALVGGASLKAEDFLSIARAFPALAEA